MEYDGKTLSAKTRKGSNLIFDKQDLVTRVTEDRSFTTMNYDGSIYQVRDGFSFDRLVSSNI